MKNTMQTSTICFNYCKTGLVYQRNEEKTIINYGYWPKKPALANISDEISYLELLKKIQTL